MEDCSWVISIETPMARGHLLRHQSEQAEVRGDGPATVSKKMAKIILQDFLPQLLDGENHILPEILFGPKNYMIDNLLDKFKAN